MTSDANVETQFRETMRENSRLAQELGAPHITTEPGGPSFEGQPRDEALRLFCDEVIPAMR